MRRLLHGIAAAGVAGMAALALTAPAEAKTCSERLKVCHRFCIKSESGSPGCVAKCGEYLQVVPRERLLGKQVRRQGMRPHPAVGARASAFTTKSPMCLSATGR